MNPRFKVTVTTDTNVEVAMDMFDDRADADAMFESLLSDDESNPLGAMPWRCVTVSLEEFHHGSWVPVTRRLVVG